MKYIYEVYLHGHGCYHATVEVEAQSKEEAEAIAMEEVRDRDWKECAPPEEEVTLTYIVEKGATAEAPGQEEVPNNLEV